MAADTTPADALHSLGNALHSLRVGHPVRDALVYVPAGVLFAVSAVAAVALAVSIVVETAREIGGMIVGLALTALSAGFSGTAILLAIPWGLWAALVAIVAWIVRRRRVLLLEPVAFARPRPAPPPRTGRLERGIAWLRERRGRVIAGTLALIALAELAIELSIDRPFGGAHGWGIAPRVGLAIVGQAIPLAVSLLPVTWATWALTQLARRLTRLAHAWRERRSYRAMTVADLGVPALRRDRSAARGRARMGVGWRIAPLSGARCLGFRLVGRVGRARIDDAELAELFVDDGSEMVAARAAASVVVLPDPQERVRELQAAQRERVQSFLQARDLPMSPDLELAESLLMEGDAVVVHGIAGTEPAGGTGYRTASERRVLSDADGQPLLVECA